MIQSHDDSSNEILQFRNLIVEARKKAGITQEELARRMGCSSSWISRVETGKRILDVAEFLALLDALEQDPFELLQQWMDLTPKE